MTTPKSTSPDDKPRKPAARKSRPKSSSKTKAESTSAAKKKSAATKKNQPAKATKKTRRTNPWKKLGLGPELLASLDKAGFEEPSDIQRELIPHALKGSDCLGQARTGTGKTAAFALPLLQMIEPGGGLQAIILAPTRELADQVDQHVRNLRGEIKARTVLVLGGRRVKEQVDALRNNPEIAIGTPGRVLDLMRRKNLDIRNIRFAVLDEVDRMLDIGFRDDIRRILRAIEAKHQTIFVSATIDEQIERLARSFMTDPVEVNVSHDMLTVDAIEHGFVTVHPDDKFATLLGLLKHESPQLVIVFTNTKHKARKVAQALKKEGVDCKEIHGDLVQERRDRVMRSFRKQSIQVLVATDLASRGLDVMDITHIVNYDVPEDPSGYVHRIGRTARMGKTGYAVTFVTREQGKLLTEIEKLINKELPQFDPSWLVKRIPTQEEIAAAAAAAEEARESDRNTENRYTMPLHRDAIIESHGIRPVKRTLGSRFRPTRRRR